MDKLKNRWDIVKNWQLLFPILGVLLLGLTAYTFSRRFLHAFDLNNTAFEWPFTLGVAALLFYVMLRFFLWCFEKLKDRWIVTYRWEMIAIFIVFAVTGTSSVRIGRPILKAIGITQENLPALVYWVVFIICSLLFYQILLVCFGWLFGQFQFFWNFEKKMLKRFGLNFFIKSK